MFRVVECGSCHLLRLDPQPYGLELASYYPPDYWFAPGKSIAARLEEAYRRFVLRDHVRFVKRALDEAEGDGTVLDVGCGGGLFLAELRASQMLGIDNSTRAARVAWRQNLVPAICADVREAPLRAGSCRAITMFHVLEHLSNPAPYLDAARALLAPSGRLIVQVPNAECWQFRLLRGRWNGIDIPRHLINYRRSDLLALLNYCGFEVLREKHFSLRDSPAGLATSLVPSLDPMARRVRGVRENGAMKLTKDALYFSLVLAAIPFTLIEATAGAGSTIMLEARRKT